MKNVPKWHSIQLIGYFSLKGLQVRKALNRSKTSTGPRRIKRVAIKQNLIGEPNAESLP
jgi:hypothetical protein